MPKSNSEWSFSRGTVANAQRVFFTSFPDAGENQPMEVTQIVCWSPTKTSSFMLPWEVKGIVYLEYPVPHGVIISPFGQVYVSTPRANAEEIVAAPEEGQEGRGVLRDLRVIGQHVFVVGMSRQCYQRRCGQNPLSDASWVRYDAGVVKPAPSDAIVGFNSIDGFSEQDIYAVGWQGEVWHFDGKRWSQAPSVTNLKLERVVCAGNGTVYAVGQAGVIVRGRGEQWEAIAQGDTAEQIWGAAWYRERLWLATHQNVYVLRDDGSLELVDFGITESLTCGWLMCGDGVLWSVGRNHLLWTADGVSWTQLFI